MRPLSIVICFVVFLGSQLLFDTAKADNHELADKHEAGVGLGILDGGIVGFGRYGFNLHKNFRLEAEAGTGASIIGDINYFVSAFAVGRIPYGRNNSAIYARAGVGVMQVDLDFLFITGTETRTIGTVGVGWEHFFNNSWGLRIDANALVNPKTFSGPDSVGAYGTLSVVKRF